MVGQSGYEAGMFCLLHSLWCHSSGVSQLKTWALWCSLRCVCSCKAKWTVSSPAAGISMKNGNKISNQTDKVGRTGDTGEQNTVNIFNDTHIGEES